MNNETIISAAALLVSVLTLAITIATLIFTVKNSKGYIHRKIDKNQCQIRQIEHNEVLKYGLNGRFPHIVTSDDEKKKQLQKEISELERKL